MMLWYIFSLLANKGNIFLGGFFLPPVMMVEIVIPTHTHKSEYFCDVCMGGMLCIFQFVDLSEKLCWFPMFFLCVCVCYTLFRFCAALAIYLWLSVACSVSESFLLFAFLLFFVQLAAVFFSSSGGGGGKGHSYRANTTHNQRISWNRTSHWIPTTIQYGQVIFIGRMWKRSKIKKRSSHR